MVSPSYWYGREQTDSLRDDVAARYLSAFQADEGRQALEQWH
jgi:hypothetical protein